MRIFLITVGALVLMSVAPASAQTGFDRPGGDYSSFQVRSGDPAVCAARCERDGRCKAWSFSYPRTVHPQATCWLKREVADRVENDCCVSGVRGAGVIEPRHETIEYSTDRTGGDYRNFATPTHPTGAGCKLVCEGDSKCRAWTYARPGYAGALARCFLKDKVTTPRRKPCCISGVVR